MTFSSNRKACSIRKPFAAQLMCRVWVSENTASRCCCQKLLFFILKKFIGEPWVYETKRMTSLKDNCCSIRSILLWYMVSKLQIRRSPGRRKTGVAHLLILYTLQNDQKMLCLWVVIHSFRYAPLRVWVRTWWPFGLVCSVVWPQLTFRCVWMTLVDLWGYISW